MPLSRWVLTDSGSLRNFSSDTGMVPSGVVTMISAVANATSATRIPVTTSAADAANYQFWIECGCDLIDGCYWVDDAKLRRRFGVESGFEFPFAAADDLRSQGYVQWIMNLTPAGKKVLERLLSGVRQQEREFAHALSDQEVQQLLDLLMKLQR